MQEQELKYRLEEKDYQRILKEGAEIEPGWIRQEQANYYWETLDLRIAFAKAMLRLREENGRWEWTLKVSRRFEKGYLEGIEHNVAIEAEPDDPRVFLEGGEDPISVWLRQKKIAPSQLVLVGTMENLRLLHGGWLEGHNLELDRTTFAQGRTDFELEIETSEPDKIRLWVESQLGHLVTQTKTKYRRFLDSLR